MWYELGLLYSRAAGGKNRATMLGFTIICVVGALVLLSGYFFGTAWTGSRPEGAIGAALVPVLAGLGGGAVVFGRERLRTRRRGEALRRSLEERGEDPARPTRDGLWAYYDVQLILLRSEYEFLRLQGFGAAARLFEEAFGFTPEDPFETGPLNISPDGEALHRLRERWDRRLAMRRARGMEVPALGLQEDLDYQVFPREMTVPAELATRSAYLAISCDLLKKRYGRNPGKKLSRMPEGLRRRAERDLGEYAALTRETGRRGPGAR